MVTNEIQLATMRADIQYIKERIDSMTDSFKATTLELKQTTKELSDGFLTLERGRLTRLETAMAEFRVIHKVEAGSTARWVSFWTTVATAVAIAFVFLVLRLFIPNL